VISPTVDTKALEQIFRHKILLAKGKITRDMIALLVEDPVFSGNKWRHSGFNLSRILPRQEKSMARQVGIGHYIIQASFSQARMTYLPDEASAKADHRETGQVEYQSKDGRKPRHKKSSSIWISGR